MKTRTYVRATGLFSGLRVPQSARGKYVLVAQGKVVGTAASPSRLLKVAREKNVRPVILHVPQKESLIAAY